MGLRNQTAVRHEKENIKSVICDGISQVQIFFATIKLALHVNLYTLSKKFRLNISQPGRANRDQYILFDRDQFLVYSLMIVFTKQHAILLIKFLSDI